MVPQEVLPLDEERVAAALGHRERYSDGAGRFLLARPFGTVEVVVVGPPAAALVLRCRWPRRISVDHQAHVRDVVDAFNRTSPGPALSLTVTDRGEIVVLAQCAHWLPAGVTESQLAGILARAWVALPAALATMDHAFPDPFAAAS